MRILFSGAVVYYAVVYYAVVYDGEIISRIKTSITFLSLIFT